VIESPTGVLFMEPQGSVRLSPTMNYVVWKTPKTCCLQCIQLRRIRSDIFFSKVRKLFAVDPFADMSRV
jgi:hypothetical protein